MLLFNMCEAEKKLTPLTKIVFKPFFLLHQNFWQLFKKPLSYIYGTHCPSIFAPLGK